MTNAHGTFIRDELLTTDPDAATDFYGKVFGWRARGAGQPLDCAGAGPARGYVRAQRPGEARGAAGVNGITPCLWFDGLAEEAANFYAATIPGSSVGKVVRAPADFPSGRKGDVLTVEFTLAGRPFLGLNGGPHFTFNEAVSFVLHCADQTAVDRLWDALSAVPEAEQCGWCKDRYGLSWQIVPDVVPGLLADPDTARAERAMQAILGRKSSTSPCSSGRRKVPGHDPDTL